MADLAKSVVPSLATTIPISGGNYLTLIAAVDMAAGDMVYITSAGKFDLTNGVAADALALYYGMVARACKAGQPVTAYHGVEFYYGSGLTPGARYYIDATNVGQLDTAATTGGTVPCAIATAADRIYIISPTR